MPPRDAAGPRRPGPGRLRRLVALAACAPPLVALAAVGGSIALEPTGVELPCFLLPSGRVLAHGPPCPLSRSGVLQAVRVEGRLLEGTPAALRRALRIFPARTAAELHVRSAGGTSWSPLAAERPDRRTRILRLLRFLPLVAGPLLLPLLLLRTGAPAATPLALVYGHAAGLATAAAFARGVPGLLPLGVVSGSFVPGALLHLTLTFPRVRPVLEQVRGLVAAPYLATALLLPLGLVALASDADLWPVFTRLAVLLTAFAWAALVASCLFALRESRSGLERARARLVVLGALVLPGFVTAGLAGRAPAALPLPLLHLASALALLPVPLGLAIGRYDLFGVERRLRLWIGRLSVAAAVSIAAALLLTALSNLAQGEGGLPGPLGFSAIFGVVALAEGFRPRLLGAVDSLTAPRAPLLAAERRDLERTLAELRNEDDVAEELAGCLERALRPEFVVVALASERGLHPVGHRPAAGGPAASGEALAAAARLCRHGVVLLDRELRERDPDRRRLARHRAAAAAGLLDRGELLGIAVLGEPRDAEPLGSPELDFLASAARHAGLALRNARLARELAEVERSAATAALALGLAHDMGKQLAWAEGLVRRLPARIDEGSPRLRRDLEILEDLVVELRAGLRDLVEGAAGAAATPGSGRRLDEMVVRAVAAVGRLHRKPPVAVELDGPAARWRGPRLLERVIQNLVENAVLASPPDAPVRVTAARAGGVVELRVVDRGPGAPPGGFERAFEVGWSSGGRRPGHGLGLPVCRELCRSLGAVLHLSAAPGGGTVASVRLPEGPRE